MSDLSDCCYGMGFGPEGDGVELIDRAAAAQIVRDACVVQTTAYLKGNPCKWGFVAADDEMNAHPDDMGFGKLFAAYARMHCRPGSFENIQWPQFTFETKESTAKPSLPALTRQAGEKYKGLGFCDSTT